MSLDNEAATIAIPQHQRIIVRHNNRMPVVSLVIFILALLADGGLLWLDRPNTLVGLIIFVVLCLGLLLTFIPIFIHPLVLDIDDMGIRTYGPRKRVSSDVRWEEIAYIYAHRQRRSIIATICISPLGRQSFLIRNASTSSGLANSSSIEQVALYGIDFDCTHNNLSYDQLIGTMRAQYGYNLQKYGITLYELV